MATSKQLQHIARTYGTPLYTYGADIIRQQFFDLKAAVSYRDFNIHYACKANSNLAILRLLRRLGSNIECVSRGEIMAAQKAGFKKNQIIYTCSNASIEELKFAIKMAGQLNLDSIGQIKQYGLINPGGNISIRLNQGIGAGHHSHVITGGPDSKFGMTLEQIPEALGMARQYRLKIIGVHQHIGSNILDYKILIRAAKKLLSSARQFPDLKFIDFGGGLGVPYRPTDKPLDMRAFGLELSLLFGDFVARYGRPLKLVLEPGRFLVAEAGTLLVEVTDIKQTQRHRFIGVNSGFNHLLRPALYGSYHHIDNVSNPKGKYEVVAVAGNICESGDVFAKRRQIRQCRVGDILAIQTVGAYGFSMSSNYNLRPRPAEIMIDKNTVKLIRRRKKEADFI
jgi:diaminopimelate decarboxylase